jgi:MFS family permease
VTRRFRPLNVMAFGYLLIGVGFGLNAFAGTALALAACVVVFTFGEMCAMPVSSAFVAGLAPRHMRGRYMGAYGLTWTVSQVVGPSLGLRLLAQLPTGWWLCGGSLGLVSAVIALACREAAPAPDAPGTGSLVRPRSGTAPVPRRPG